MTDEEINRRIHEEIMGAKWYRPKETGEGSATRYLLTDEIAKVMERQGFVQPATGDEPNEVADVPDYCRSIEQAFKVVEELRSRWFQLDANETQFFRFIDCCEHGWRVEICWGHHDGDALITEAVDLLLSRAICLAALKTLESKS